MSEVFVSPQPQARQGAVLPSLFISHGSPDTVIARTPANAFLRDVASSLPRPKAIVVVSAHFELPDLVGVTADAAPETIHDFGGFQQELYEMQYPAPGAPELAEQISADLAAQGFTARTLVERGFDHGVWVPLILMYPEADIPVVVVSVDPQGGPEHHLRLGRALAKLAREDVLVVGSGSFTHNLPEAFVNVRQGARDAAVPAWAQEFADWMCERISAADLDALLAYRDRAPHASRNHPTDEHLMPLFVAMGVAGDRFAATQLHRSDEFGVLSMAMWRFDPAPAER
ncbi:DODA-type extradiol aromatic ring-opening family dioxygenase [Pseudohoeflea coraliihabitans]|uniref:Dioxygenase n=1 Tax=Pseudohoeflea coraliihabitans TaxID=2860393 RepID=A0ABS6WQ02_9HYPH|nr:class III extradiol ring-cleavage dioxygenase [Pseudohoeflea sp. DP4N28-3]MBW3098047.1 dioxygenase [Pseudohoeflea sp. DP4N28-3]